MNPIKEFLTEAKANPKLWSRLSIRAAKIMALYGVMTYVLYYFTGMKYLGGKDANFFGLFVLLFIAAVVISFIRLLADIRKERK